LNFLAQDRANLAGLSMPTVTPTVLATVTYELTDLGLSLHHLMRQVKERAEQRMDQVLTNRNPHDAHVA
jgi:DNA-binding HxlR family transcriptional regulator